MVAGGGKTGQQSAGDKDDKNDVLKQFKAVVSKIPPKGDFTSKVKKSGVDLQNLQVLVKKLKIEDLNTLIKLLNIQKWERPRTVTERSASRVAAMLWPSSQPPSTSPSASRAAAMTRLFRDWVSGMEGSIVEGWMGPD